MQPDQGERDERNCTLRNERPVGYHHDQSSVCPELELLLQGQGNTIDQGLALESALGALAVSSEEAKDLLAKFLNKKK